MRKFMILTVLFPSLLTAGAAIERELPAPGELPYNLWSTGTFLAETAVNVTAIEPFLVFYSSYGNYKGDWSLKGSEALWTINPMLQIDIEFSKRAGIEVVGGVISNFKGNKSATNFMDTIVILGYQILNAKRHTPIPNFRLGMQLIFPSGKYDRLDPSKDEIDVTGQGAYFFGPLLAFSKTFEFPCHFFKLYWSLGYFFPTLAHVKGLNAYGGGRGTDGKIRPGQFLQAILSGEYSLHSNWVFGFDLQFVYQRATSNFRGRLGVSDRGIPNQVGLPSSIQISFAPQLEYNFSNNSGLLFGSWLTLAGYNTRAFASAFFAYLYIF